MAWMFREMSRGEMYADPSAGEFFTPEGFADSLIRESIQNSLDARQQSARVHVRFHLSSDEESLSSKDAERYLGGLWPHLDALDGGRENRPESGSSMPFLVVEDFGTRGLGGPDDVEPNIELGPQRGEDFSYFWRNVGRSNKQDTERGRWGLGKTVFPATSQVNSFFGLTVRAEDKRTLLMGQSVLKIHNIEKKRFCPYGFYAKHQNDGFQQPITDPDVLEAFRRDFCLKRTDEPGLSVVVPFPDRDEIKAGHMIRSAVLHYFYPILRGELAVEVSGDAMHVILDSHSIDEVANSVEWSDTDYSVEQLRHLFRFARCTLEFGDDDMLTLPLPEPSRAPDWNTGRFDDAVIQSIKSQFAKSKMLAVRVPVTVRPKLGEDRTSHFDLFVEHDADLDGPEDHYIRQGITISKISTLREKEYRGLVVVNDQALSTLLGDSENPSHTEWVEKATKLKQRFDWGPYTVRFVRNALQRVVSQLLYIPEGRDDDLLRELFFVQEENNEADKKKRKKKRSDQGGNGDPPPPPPPPQPKAFELQKIEGGFRLIREESERPLPARIDVEVAYQVRRGNPFRKYDKNDFQLEKRPVKIETVGAPTCAVGNTLEVVPENESFLVQVTGFDANRDLAVKATPKQQEDVNASQI